MKLPASPSSEQHNLKPPVSADTRQRVIELRRSHSYAEVAKQTGLPVGTVKTICTRSGAFRDNPTHRALFSLPPIKASEQTALTVPQLPLQHGVTGDDEVDAVLWLREVIGTGRAELIAKAMLAVKKIKTPLKELEKRYSKHLFSKHPGDWTVMFKTIGFADLEDLARRSIRKLTLCNEALARFGDEASLFADTPAEQFCIKAMAGAKRDRKIDMFLDDDDVTKRFKARPDLMPHTLSDCLYELATGMTCIHCAAPVGAVTKGNRLTHERALHLVASPKYDRETKRNLLPCCAIWRKWSAWTGKRWTPFC